MRSLSLDYEPVSCQWWTLPSSTSLYDKRGWIMSTTRPNVAVISESGKTIFYVCPFSPDYEPVALPVVDVAVQNENPYDGKSYIFVVTNALHVPSMEYNLIREAGIRVNGTPKIQVEDPSESDHAITFQETELWIPLTLYGVFSFFRHLSQAMRSWHTQRMSIYLPQPDGIHIQMLTLRTRGRCWTGREAFGSERNGSDNV
jgi:hypothetical protein